MEIELSYSPTEDDVRALYDGLVEFNESWFPGDYEKKLGLFIRDEKGGIAGGLYALVHFTTINVKYLWLSQGQRGLGVGAALLERLQAEAEKGNIHCIYLDTYSFQAPSFYEKNGYVEVGRYRDCPRPGVDKIFYEKRLARS